MMIYLQSISINNKEIFDEYFQTNRSINSWCSLFQLSLSTDTNQIPSINSVYKVIHSKLKNCIVIYDNDNDLINRNNILHHWLPWFNVSYIKQTNYHKFNVNLYNYNHNHNHNHLQFETDSHNFLKSIETIETVRNDLKDMLNSIYSCDIKLYNLLLDLYHKQIKLLSTSSYILN